METDTKADDAPRSCPLCGGNDSADLPAYSREHWRVVECAGCGFTYLSNPPGYEALETDFAWEKTFVEERAAREARTDASARIDGLTRWRLKLFRRNEQDLYLSLFGPGRVLDVGCGGGDRLAAEQTPYGIEISKALFEAADEVMRARGGRAVHAPAVEGIDAFPDGFFDGILLRSFLEHETQPELLLERAHRVLAEDGKLYIRVPNFGSVNRRVMGRKWCGFRYPDHVNYFTLSGLKKMARGIGFKVKVLNRLTLPFDDNIKAVLTRAA